MDPFKKNCYLVSSAKEVISVEKDSIHYVVPFTI